MNKYECKHLPIKLYITKFHLVVHFSALLKINVSISIQRAQGLCQEYSVLDPTVSMTYVTSALLKLRVWGSCAYDALHT